MKTKHEAPTDANDTPYAYAFARPNSWGDGAELHLALRRLMPDYAARGLSLEATAYVSRDFSGVYGMRLVSDDTGRHELAAMQAMVKAMQQIEKRLTALNNELGYVKSNDFPEYCRRVCVAAGIEYVYLEAGYNAGLVDRHGCKRRSIFELRCINPKKDGAGFLMAMQTLTDETITERGKRPEPVAA